MGQPEAVRENDVRAGRDPDAGFDLHTVFLHDLPPDLVAELKAQSDDDPAESLFGEPFPLPSWPDVATEVLCGRDDRLFPLELQRRIARERLGLAVQELPGGHLMALSQPEALTEQLLRPAGRPRRPPGPWPPAH